jgi:hypothetical protein
VAAHEHRNCKGQSWPPAALFFRSLSVQDQPLKLVINRPFPAPGGPNLGAARLALAGQDVPVAGGFSNPEPGAPFGSHIFAFYTPGVGAMPRSLECLQLQAFSLQ